VGVTTVNRWSGRETRLLRNALRLTVRTFAEDLGVCVRTVSKWEAVGAGLTPRPELQAALDTMLRRSTEEDRERFHAVFWTATSTMAPVASPIEPRIEATAQVASGCDPRQVSAALTDARRYLDGAVVDYFRRRLALLKADDGQLGTRTVRPLILGLLGAVQEHAAEVKPAVRRDLLSVGAESAEFAGWLFRDAHDAPRALYWHDRATEWAQEASDAAMQGYVLLKKAQLAYDEREPLRMLTLTQAARSGPWSLPLRVQAEAAQQEARAEAMLGASPAVIQRHLDQAQNLLSAVGSGPDDNRLAAHYNETLLMMQTAVCYAEAGRPGRAVEIYRASLTPSGFSPRDYGFFLSWMASAQALAGEPDQAAVTGLDSAERATHAGSGRTRRELLRVLDTLQPWRHRPAVRELAAAVGAQRGND
jgi:transcriptional regulator with XRE-family HTH domain